MSSSDLSDYLVDNQYIDWQNNHIFQLAKSLARNTTNNIEIAKNCFEFVRDKIEHSVDYQRNGISCTASQVLANGHGFCYAKSHLLTALLRANDIPAGLCYQRLQMGDNCFGLHGLVAVYLSVDDDLADKLHDKFNWYRLDPRGNKSGINSQFSLSEERLAYQAQQAGEVDFTEVFAEPLPCVVDVLNRYADYHEIMTNLPDVERLS